MSDEYYQDKEKAVRIELPETEVAPDQAIAKRFGAFGPFLEKLFASVGSERDKEYMEQHMFHPRHPMKLIDVVQPLLLLTTTRFRSVNTVLTTIPIGVLGQFVFTLTFPHAVATILCFGFLGAIATAFVATLGPQTGLRTMIITRYSSGYWLYSVFHSQHPHA
ncbi:hypothetical protein EDD16DRAFT_1726389, partial [Pisolithus croceorrhizus]